MVQLCCFLVANTFVFSFTIQPLSTMAVIITTVLSALFIISRSTSFTHNIVFNGPFNQYANKIPSRRLQTDDSDAQNISFYHGVASGDPTDEDLVVCLVYD